MLSMNKVETLEARLALTGVSFELESLSVSRAFGEEVSDLPAIVQGLETADLNGDGDVDLLTTHSKSHHRWEESDLALYARNAMGKLSFLKLINPGHVVDVFATEDTDLDGDIDIVSVSQNGLQIHENDGDGNFHLLLIDENIHSFDSISLELIDFDQDGDVDIATLDSSSLAWYENDGTGNVFTRHELAAELHDSVQNLAARDWDKDGDTDFFYVAQSFAKGDGQLVWLSNQGNDTFEESVLQTGDPVISYAFADVDVDGSDELLVAARGDHQIIPKPEATVYIHLFSPSEEAAFAPIAVGRDDVAILAEIPGVTGINVVHGFGGLGNNFRLSTLEFGDHDSGVVVAATNVDSQSGLPISVGVADVDGDSVSDLVVLNFDGNSGGVYRFDTYRTRLTGDANNDSVVDFADFLVMASSFGEELNAVWADGDFDGDGAVLFSDFLVLADNFGRFA